MNLWLHLRQGHWTSLATQTLSVWFGAILLTPILPTPILPIKNQIVPFHLLNQTCFFFFDKLFFGLEGEMAQFS